MESEYAEVKAHYQDLKVSLNLNESDIIYYGNLRHLCHLLLM